MATVGVNELSSFSFLTKEMAGQFWGKISKVKVTGDKNQFCGARFPWTIRNPINNDEHQETTFPFYPCLNLNIDLCCRWS